MVEQVGRLPRSEKGEYFLTDLVAPTVAAGHKVEAVQPTDPDEILGVNTQAQLADVNKIALDRIRARLLDAGVRVALATDCNPGSCFTSSMPFCIALAVRELRMTPAEAVWAATAGGAEALRRKDIGRIAPGARADLHNLLGGANDRFFMFHNHHRIAAVAKLFDGGEQLVDVARVQAD